MRTRALSGVLVGALGVGTGCGLAAPWAGDATLVLAVDSGVRDASAQGVTCEDLGDEVMAATGFADSSFVLRFRPDATAEFSLFMLGVQWENPGAVDVDDRAEGYEDLPITRSGDQFRLNQVPVVSEVGRTGTVSGTFRCPYVLDSTGEL